MKVIMRKIGNYVGAIMPAELHVKPGDKYEVIKYGDTLVMTPSRDNLFSNNDDWKGFRESISEEDVEWDRAN